MKSQPLKGNEQPETWAFAQAPRVDNFAISEIICRTGVVPVIKEKEERHREKQYKNRRFVSRGRCE